LQTQTIKNNPETIANDHKRLKRLQNVLGNDRKRSETICANDPETIANDRRLICKRSQTIANVNKRWKRSQTITNVTKRRKDRSKRSLTIATDHQPIANDRKQKSQTIANDRKRS
jgi:hypothetical protein